LWKGSSGTQRGKMTMSYYFSRMVAPSFGEAICRGTKGLKRLIINVWSHKESLDRAITFN